VGKTTIATNLAAAMSRRGPTLLIDLDVQGSSTVALGKNLNKNGNSSWALLNTRFAPPAETISQKNSFFLSLKKNINNFERRIFRFVLGDGNVTSLVITVEECFDLIPAGPELFNSVNNFQINNLVYNLNLCREYYKYIIIDTPSIWNNLISKLYLISDLNLIPVTLNALSTKSLRDYLTNVITFSRRYSRTHIRIVKNEVYGNADSKNIGKTRTMIENRRYLESLCEQVAFNSKGGMSILPQPILFDLEIPESALVRNAQDQGVTVYSCHQYAKVKKAFDGLAEKVQYVLNSNNNISYYEKRDRIAKGIEIFSFVTAILIFFLITYTYKSVDSTIAPTPVAPQQIVVPKSGFITHTFKVEESIDKIAKHALCKFTAIVPSYDEIEEYISEVLEVYNLTKKSYQPNITRYYVPAGTSVTFYPPAKLKKNIELIPVYEYFIKIVDDEFAYVTGDWCERGSGGGQPHYGIDIAAEAGSKVFSPMDGKVYLLTNEVAGNSMAIVKDEMMLYFCHLDKRFFSNGSIVKKGDAIGTVGSTGRATGPHVHVGYGIKSSSGEIKIGKSYYKITDPKFFFYREMFFNRNS
ncbi:MAG: peptidoglycan DD-metalloendopeptidase family protein, partial [Chitinispirillaceae bacterium]|nr:peptidoglycan DD-metalloendopeptidase family protein [Chitinispirillaceae bacterium]